MKNKRECLFCKSQKELTKEHIFAQWLLEELDIYNEKMYMAQNSFVGDVDTRTHAYSSFVNGKVCGACNNGWMSDLETECKEIVRLLISDNDDDFILGIQALNKDNYKLAKWVFKIAILINYTGNYKYKETVPKEHFYSLYEGKIPKDVYIDIGIVSPENDTVCEFRQDRHNSLIVRDQEIMKVTTINPLCYKVTFQLKRLMVKVSFLQSDYCTYYDNEGAIRLNPEFGMLDSIKSFDIIDNFHIHGCFHEYVTKE